MGLIGKNTRKLVKYGLKYLKTQLAFLILFVPPLAFILLRPFLVRYLIDNIVAEGKKSALIPFLIIFVLTVILERLSSFLLNVYTVKATCKVVKNEQIELYNHFQKQDINHISAQSTGDVITKVISDVQMMAPAMVINLPKIIFNFIALVSYMCVLFFFNWQLSVIVLCSIPLYYLSQRMLTQRLRQSSRQERESFSKLNESLREKVEGIWVIKG